MDSSPTRIAPRLHIKPLIRRGDVLCTVPEHDIETSFTGLEPGPPLAFTLRELTTLQTVHSSAPTVSEVLSQIPEELLGAVVYFECLEAGTVLYGFA